MAIEPQTAADQEQPAPSDLIEKASALVRAHPECFWFWHREAQVRTLDDVRRVVEHLREYGNRYTWWEAQELHKCLLPLYKKPREERILRQD